MNKETASLQCRHDVANALTTIIQNASDDDLRKAHAALRELKNIDHRVYQSLLGQSLLADVVNEINDQFEYRLQAEPATA